MKDFFGWREQQEGWESEEFEEATLGLPTKKMDKASAATLKMALNNSVNGFESVAWKLENQYEGVDPKAVAELRALYKQAKKIQKGIVSAIDKSKA